MKLDTNIETRYHAVLDAAAAGIIGLPAGVAAWVRSMAMMCDELAASRQAVAMFVGDWRSAAPIATAGQMSIAALSAPLNAQAFGQAVDRLVALEGEAARAKARYDLASAVSEKLGDLQHSVFGEAGMLGVLRPALADLFAEVRQLPTGCPMSAEEAVGKPETAQTAYMALVELLGRYRVLREAWRDVESSPLLPDDRDAGQLFRDSPIWPALKAPTINLGNFTAAGPTGPGRLLWLAGPGKGWLPSRDEENDVANAFARAASQRPEDRKVAPGLTVK